MVIGSSLEMANWKRPSILLGLLALSFLHIVLAQEKLVKTDAWSRPKRNTGARTCLAHEELVTNLDTERYYRSSQSRRAYLVELSWRQKSTNTDPSDDPATGCPDFVSQCFHGSEVDLVACDCKVWEKPSLYGGSHYHLVTRVLLVAPKWQNDEAVDRLLELQCRSVSDPAFLADSVVIKGLADDVSDDRLVNDAKFWIYILVGLAALAIVILLSCYYQRHCCERNETDQVRSRAIVRHLSELIGPSPKIKVEKFQNWASIQIVKEALTVRPRSVEEVQAVIRAAATLRLQVRAAGESHSWTRFFHSGGLKEIIMYTGDIQRPMGAPRIELSKTSRGTFVTFGPGVTTGEFLEFQLANHVSIPANTVVRAVTMAGVVAGACHGAGRDVQTVSDRVVRMRVVDSRGELRTYSLEEDPDMMRALQCNLGLWGIMIDITIKVDPMKIVQTENRWLTVGEVFYNKETLKRLVTENWSVEFFWFPFNSISHWAGFKAFVMKRLDIKEWQPHEDLVLARLINFSTAAQDVTRSQDQIDADNKRDLEQAKRLDTFDQFIASYPQAAPAFIREQISVVLENYKGTLTQPLPLAVHYTDYVERVPLYNMEWAFSVDNDFNNLCYATQKVVELVHSEAQQGRFPMNLALEMRFIADSNAYIAPAIAGNRAHGGTGLTCYIEVISIARTPGFEEFCSQVYDIWKVLQGARPHWCKMWDFLPNIDHFIRQAYKNQFPKFLAALQRSGADPHGMFFPARLEKVFYPHGHPGKRCHQQNNHGMLLEKKKNGLNIHSC